MTDVLLLTGGRTPYVDPWHPFAATSDALAELARDVGFEVEVSADGADRLADLSGVELLIANVPVPDVPLDAAVLARAQAGLDEFFARPGGTLALHVNVTTLFGLDGWSERIGARWVAGQTMHPPRGVAKVQALDGDELSADIGEFELDDELYSFMEFEGDRSVLVEHKFSDVTHPLVWTREVAQTRVVADALGHGPESFDSDEHKELLRRSMRWAANDAPRPGSASPSS